MYILGIDPGFAIVGWGIVEASRGKVRPVAYGAITTPAHTPIESRLLMIQNDLEAIIDKYHPDEMAVEELFFNTNITTGIAVAEARGVIICTAHKHGVKVSEYTPLQVKQAVVGYGKAEKQQHSCAAGGNCKDNKNNGVVERIKGGGGNGQRKQQNGKHG